MKFPYSTCKYTCSFVKAHKRKEQVPSENVRVANIYYNPGDGMHEGLGVT